MDKLRIVLDRIVEVCVLGILGFMVVKGSPAVQAISGTTFVAVFVSRTKDRTRRQTGWGSVRPPPKHVSIRDKDGDDDPPPPPPAAKTGFTGAPPPQENGPSDPPASLTALVGFTLVSLLSSVAVATILALLSASCGPVNAPTERDVTFLSEIRACKTKASFEHTGWDGYLPCRATVLARYDGDGDASAARDVGDAGKDGAP